MGFLRDLTVRIKGDNKDLKKKLDESKQDVEVFGTTIKKAGAAFGAFITGAVAVAGAMVMWFKQTAAGVDMMNTGLAVTKQLMNDLMYHQKSNIKEAISIAKEENAIRIQNRKDLLENSLVERDIRRLRLDSIDINKSLAEQIKAATTAIEKTKELEEKKKALLYQELDIVQRKIKIDGASEKLQEQLYQIMSEIVKLDNTESLRMVGAKNALIQEQIQRTKELVDAFAPVQGVIARTNAELSSYRKELEGAELGDQKYIETLKIKINRLEAYLKQLTEVNNTINKVSTSQLGSLPQNNTTKSVFDQKTYGVAPSLSRNVLQGYSGTNDPDAAKKMAESVQDLTDGLTEQQQALISLSEQFGSFFSSVDHGFKGMIDNVIKSIQRLVQELIAKAVILTILTAITGGTINPAMFMQLLPSGMGSAFPGSSGGGGGGMPGVGPGASAGGSKLVATLRGKDIAIALERYNSDNS